MMKHLIADDRLRTYDEIFHRSISSEQRRVRQMIDRLETSYIIIKYSKQQEIFNEKIFS